LSIDAHSDPAIFTVVLAINDKHTLSVKHLPTSESSSSDIYSTDQLDLGEENGVGYRV
jgi:hypothetical protein